MRVIARVVRMGVAIIEAVVLRMLVCMPNLEHAMLHDRVPHRIMRGTERSIEERQEGQNERQQGDHHAARNPFDVQCPQR